MTGGVPSAHIMVSNYKGALYRLAGHSYCINIHMYLLYFCYMQNFIEKSGVMALRNIPEGGRGGIHL